jgi:hypothetical protein
MVCRRGGEDKLLNALAVKWSVNLLRIPREGIEVGDVFVAKKRILSQSDRLRNLYKPELVLPEPDKQAVVDLDQTESQRYAAAAGFEALQGFLLALGLPPLPLRAAIKAARQTKVSLSFKVGGITRTALLAGEIKREMEHRKKGARWGTVDPKSQYLVAHAVWTATSLQIKLAGGSDTVGELSAKLTGVAGASGKLDAAHDSSGTIKYHRDDPVAFGVQVTRVHFEDGFPLLKDAPDLTPWQVLHSTGQATAPAGEEEQANEQYGILIGAKDGSPFVTLR